MRLIDADALKESMGTPTPRDILEEKINKIICAYIDNAPTVDERQQGEWLFDKENSFTIDMFKCSICGYFGHTHFNFCPNCGSDMRGAE